MRATSREILREPERFAAFIARDGSAGGFRGGVAAGHDYVNGCDTSPVGFLEGIYVDPARRRAGVARALLAAAEGWVRERGCANSPPMRFSTMWTATRCTRRWVSTKPNVS